MPRKTRIQAILDRAVESVSHRIIADAIQQVPATTTVGELTKAMAEAGFRNQLKQMTIAEFAAACSGGTAPAGRASRATRASAPRKRRAGKVNTRTESGRAAIDQAIAEFLKAHKGPARSEHIAAKVSASTLQIREALKRLIDGKKVRKTGERRGTAYSWVDGGAGAGERKPRAAGKKKAGRKKTKGKKTRG